MLIQWKVRTDDDLQTFASSISRASLPSIFSSSSIVAGGVATTISGIKIMPWSGRGHKRLDLIGWI